MTETENKITETSDEQPKGWNYGWGGLLVFLLTLAAIIALSILASPKAESAREPLFKVVYTCSPSKGETYKVIRDTECGTEYGVYENKNGVSVFLRVNPDGKPFTTSKYTGEGYPK